MSNTKHLVGFQCDDKLHSQLLALAEAQDRSVSWLCRQAVSLLLEEEEKRGTQNQKS
jgi:predicted transcriptional regulator